MGIRDEIKKKARELAAEAGGVVKEAGRDLVEAGQHAAVVAHDLAARLSEPPDDDEVRVGPTQVAVELSHTKLDPSQIDGYLAAFPGWSEASATDRRAAATVLADKAFLFHLALGQVLVHPLAAESGVWFLIDGQVNEFGYSSRLGKATRGDWVGLSEVIAGGEPGAAGGGKVAQAPLQEATASTAGLAIAFSRDAVLAILDGLEHRWLAHLWFAYLARKLFAGVRHSQLLQANDQDVFFPAMRGQLVPGPYVGDGIVLNIFLCDPPPNRFRELLPPHVRWHPSFEFFYFIAANMGVWHHGTVDEGVKFRYTELSVMLPVEIDGKLHVYHPYLLPSSLQAVFGGREVYGMPKIPAASYIDSDPGQVVTRYGGKTIVEINYDEVEPWEVQPSVLFDLFHHLFRRTADPGASRDGMGAAADIFAWLDNPLDGILARLADKVGQRVPASVGKEIQADVLSLVNAGLAKFPDAGRLLGTAWKRIPSMVCELPPDGRIPWAPDVFDTDSLFTFPFDVTQVTGVKLLRLQDDGLRLAPAVAGSAVRSGHRYGIQLTCSMKMGAGTLLHDYRVEYAQSGIPAGYADVMDWGPAVWKVSGS